MDLVSYPARAEGLVNRISLWKVELVGHVGQSLRAWVGLNKKKKKKKKKKEKAKELWGKGGS